jgi:hypothetical protein
MKNNAGRIFYAYGKSPSRYRRRTIVYSRVYIGHHRPLADDFASCGCKYYSLKSTVGLTKISRVSLTFILLVLLLVYTQLFVSLTRWCRCLKTTGAIVFLRDGGLCCLHYILCIISLYGGVAEEGAEMRKYLVTAPPAGRPADFVHSSTRWNRRG